MAMDLKTKLEEFANEHNWDLRVVHPRWDPKQGMPQSYCVDNADEYCNKNPDWEIAAGWVWDSIYHRLVAHCWVKKRKKHKEVTQLERGIGHYGDVYLYSQRASDYIQDVCLRYSQGDPSSLGKVHSSYKLENGKWIEEHQV